jgi:hypothetical protein
VADYLNAKALPCLLFQANKSIITVFLAAPDPFI